MFHFASRSRPSNGWCGPRGGADKATHHYRAISGKTHLIRERRSRCPLEDGVGWLYNYQSHDFDKTLFYETSDLSLLNIL
jgi:hypothetical protein